MKLSEMIKKKRLSILFLVFLLPLFYLLTLIHYAGNPMSESHTTYTIDIPKGASFKRIVEILQESGLLKSKLLFYSLAISQKAASHIRAGEYEFMSDLSPFEILRKLVRGEIKGYLVTLPEDITLKEVAARLASYKLVDEKIFLDLASNRDLLDSLGIASASLEGFLYPDTYLLDRSMETREIIRIMVSQFWKKVTPEMLARAVEIGFTTEEFVTLASIIGKESGSKDEKPVISAVFHNRLRKNMKLQSDPTAVYDVRNFTGIITKKDLQNHNPHNTYRINGLPPGPIANPGIDSLRAALYPAPVDYLYFVSNNDGTHSFSSDLGAHNEAVARYRSRKERN